MSAASFSPSSPSLLPLLLARLSAFAVSGLVLIWALGFQTSFLSRNPSHRSQLIYSLMHPLLMVIGFIVISGEAILIHKWLPGSTNTKKSVHLGMQGFALFCGGFGVWTMFRSERGFVGNFYSLHSWMGLICISLFAVQWMIGFVTFWHRGEVRSVRAKVLPWHIFLGLYTYGLAVVTAETGLLVKLTFLQETRNLPRRGLESMIVNGLGLGLVVLCGCVVLTSFCPRNQNSQREKSEYSNGKCLAS